MRRRPERLTTGEWAVLSLVDEGPTHGFAVARAMAPEGEVGRVWAMRRPLVYRTLEQLEARALTRVAGTEPSATGPPRTLIQSTDEGARRVGEWLHEPVEHLRDARSELMLKLLFLDRRSADPAPLLVAQRKWLVGREEELRTGLGDAEGFTRTLALWRAESASAAIRFVDALIRR
jgi:DNA-binding PadR family transcriptional regulator